MRSRGGRDRTGPGGMFPCSDTRRLYPSPVTAQSPPWERRIDLALSAILWSSLVLGVVLSAVNATTDTFVALAAVIGATYASILQFTPRRIRDGEMIGELVAVGGVVAALIAVAITGGGDSGYVLFLAIPPFYAGAFLGRRIGLETAILTSIGFVTIVLALEQSIDGSIIQTVLLYFVIALAFSEAKRLLVEERQRSDAMAVESELFARRVARLETTHNLLSSLSALANAAELNPVTVGEAALRDLAATVPFAGGQIVLSGEEGPVILATRGDTSRDDAARVFPMSVADRHLGELTLHPFQGTSLDDHAEMIAGAMRPVALAFDNILLLQQIARRTVAEERARLARELHDDIGPSLASIGLTIDALLYQMDAEPSQARQLESMRALVTRLVERVRTTVADLRAAQSESITQTAYRLSTEVGADGPSVVIDVEERNPTRPAMSLDLAAIVTEAFRNAVRHADATEITIRGVVDRDRGTIAVEDNGEGFDPHARPAGHFGLVGLEERAGNIGAELEMTSAPGEGCTVRVTWGGSSTGHEDDAVRVRSEQG